MTLRDMLAAADLEDAATRLALSDALLDANREAEAALLRELARPVRLTARRRITAVNRAYLCVHYDVGEVGVVTRGPRYCAVWDRPADVERVKALAYAGTCTPTSRVAVLNLMRRPWPDYYMEPALHAVGCSDAEIIKALAAETADWIARREASVKQRVADNP